MICVLRVKGHTQAPSLTHILLFPLTLTPTFYFPGPPIHHPRASKGPAEDFLTHVRLGPQKLDPKDSHKTAFVSPYGQFEWNVLPMGLCNAPSAFKTMNSVFDQVISKDDLSRAKLSATDLDKGKDYPEYSLCGCTRCPTSYGMWIPATLSV